MDHQLPSWQCQCCGKNYYEDLKTMGYKCTKCGAEYKFGYTVTHVDKDGVEEVLHRKEIK
jgi:ribosomal protein L37AE/L43A